MKVEMQRTQHLRQVDNNAHSRTRATKVARCLSDIIACGDEITKECYNLLRLELFN